MGLVFGLGVCARPKSRRVRNLMIFRRIVLMVLFEQVFSCRQEGI